jgi:hypothetical protein
VGKLLDFDFLVEYKAGSTNMVADALSRHDTDEPAILTNNLAPGRSTMA